MFQCSNKTAEMLQARLHAVQIDPATYTAEPSGERYQEWLSKTNLDDVKGDISDLLVSNVEVRALYTQLVSLRCQCC